MSEVPLYMSLPAVLIVMQVSPGRVAINNGRSFADDRGIVTGRSVCVK